MALTGRFVWSILLCKFSDHPEEPESPEFFRNFLFAHSQGSIADYWSAMSYGAIDMGGSNLWGWLDLGLAADADFMKKSRSDKTQACIDAAVRVLDFGERGRMLDCNGFICITNAGAGDSGRVGNCVLLDSSNWRHTYAAHETGHVLGFDHSFDNRESAWDPSDDGREGAYGNSRDIMSAETFGGLPAVFGSRFGAAGPGMNAINRASQGWLSADRITDLDATSGQAWSTQFDVSAIDSPAVRGNPLFRIKGQGRYRDAVLPPVMYAVEFRPGTGWDAGVPADAVVIHSTAGQDVPRITWAGNDSQDWHAGDRFCDMLSHLVIDIVDIAPDRQSASVAIATGPGVGLPNMSVRRTLAHRYDLSQGLSKVRPPLWATSVNSLRERLLSHPPQFAG
jgi:hypothetical protein